MSPPPEHRPVVAGIDVVKESALLKDRWLTLSLFATAALYLALLMLQPGGEGWGRGWNMVAFLIYSVPASIAACGLALWRMGKTAGLARRIAGWVAVTAVVFPVVCVVVIRMKA